MRIPESHFFLEPTKPTGLQAQLRAQIVAAVLERRFPPGARLPSTRALAAHLGVARVTVNLAYQALEADGWLETRPRSGIFVSADPPGLLSGAAPSRRAELDWSARLSPMFAGRRRLRKPADWARYPFPFVYGQADPSVFPHNEWRDCARRALGRREFTEVAGDMAERDDPLLVAHTLSHSLPARGVHARHDELLITLGAQNALWLAAQVLAAGRPRFRAAVEDPCYPEMREILRSAGAEIVPIPVDGQGLPPEALPRDLDLVCVSPGCHAPTGVAMPAERRRALLERARRDDFLILEDDYDFELGAAGPPTPALKSADADGRALYVGSFTKALFPGLRLGYLVAPAPVIRAAQGLRAVVLRHPPGLTQRTAAHFLALGHYNAHVERLRRVLDERRRVLGPALAAAGFRTAGRAGAGGSSFWVAAPPGIDSATLAERALARGVVIEPGGAFFASDAPTRLFRAAFWSIPVERIEPGVRRLAACL